MPTQTNHVHLIASSDGKHTLSDILRDLKKYTSSQVVKAIEDNPRESRRSWMLWIFKSAGAKTQETINISFDSRISILKNASVLQCWSPK